MGKFVLISTTLSLISLAIFLPVFPVMAQGSGIPPTVQVPSANDLGIQASPVTTSGGVMRVIISIVKLAYTLFFILAIVFVLIAAYKYLTASGDTEQIKTAHKMLAWAAVAIVVAIISVAASQIVQSFISDAV